MPTLDGGKPPKKVVEQTKQKIRDKIREQKKADDEATKPEDEEKKDE
jgi:hypothetical protein